MDPHLFRSICGELYDHVPKCTHHAKQQKEDTYTMSQGRDICVTQKYLPARK